MPRHAARSSPSAGPPPPSPVSLPFATQAEYCGLLIIRLLRADNLPNMDLVTKTDAFCNKSRGAPPTAMATLLSSTSHRRPPPTFDSAGVFTLGERKATSRTVRNSLNPAWNETLSLNVRSLSESLILKVVRLDPEFLLFRPPRIPPPSNIQHT